MTVRHRSAFGNLTGAAPFRSSFMALGDGRHKLAIRSEVRDKIGKDAGDTVTIRLLERLDC